jgi:DNA-binding NtrC family response regulator
MPVALIVEENEELLFELSDIAEEQGFTTAAFTRVGEALAESRRDPPDLAVLDLHMSRESGLDVLFALDPKTTDHVILLVERESPTASAAFREIDVLLKPPDLRRYATMVSKALRDARKRAASRPPKVPRFEEMVGRSEPMRKLFRLIERVSPTEETVLITGESGTGKELVAQAIHGRSGRAQGPFVALNCGAIPPDLIDSELFGHSKGAFTGAHRSRAGAFERAEDGTLFLDEIVEMPASLQVRFLRVLETRRFRRVGGARMCRTNCRVIAATNQVPAAAVDSGELREDLFYRLSVFPVHVPPLRERPSDIPLLADHFLAELNRESGSTTVFAEEALSLLESFRWPGNVRQLRNTIARAFILAEDEIGADALPERFKRIDRSASPTVPVKVGESIRTAERRLIEATLAHHGGDKRKSAETLGISLRTLYNRLRSYEEGGFS